MSQASLRQNGLPIRWRLALLFGAVSSLVLAIMLSAAYAFYARGLYQGIDSFLIGAARQAVAQVRTGAGTSPTLPASAGVSVTMRRYDQSGTLTWVSSGETQPWLRLPALEPRSVMARPSGPAYDTVAGWLPSLQGTPQVPADSAFAFVPVAGGRWRSLLTDLGPRGFVEMTTSLARFDDTAGRLRSFLISLGLAGTAISFLASLAISGRALKPITRLITAAKQITDSETLNVRIAIPTSGDELGLLAGTLNTMLDSLEVHYRQLELISRAAPLGLALVNNRLEYVEVSETLARWNGLPRSEHLGRRPGDLFAEQGDWAQDQLRITIETGQSQVGLERSVGAAGAERFFATSFYPVNDAGFVGAGCVVQDISERKRAEKTLVESELRYRTLFDSIDQGFCLCEMLLDGAGRASDYRFLEVNPMFEEQTGLRDAVGKTARELIPGLEEHWFETYGRVALTGEPVRFVQGAEPMGRWFDVYACRVGTADQLRFAVLFRDISERRGAEQALLESETRFQAALESSRTGVWEYDPQGDELLVDGAYGTFYGLPHGPHRIPASEVSKFTPAVERERNQTIFAQALQSNEPFELQYRVLLPDLPERWLLSRGRQKLFNPEGGSEGSSEGKPKVTGTVVDITERKRAEAILETQADVLRDTLEQQNRFVSDASHELRAPLTAILGNLGVLERYPDLPTAERLEAVNEAIREAKRLGRLVSDLLTLARGDAGAQQALEEINLADVLLEAWQDASQLSHGHSLEKGTIQAVRVEGNRDRLKQLALILLDNAIKYTPVGGRVKLELCRIETVRGPLAEVTVTDSGPGIAAEDLAHVFERFYRADRSRSPGADPGGTGLGLPIAQSIAKGHDGEIYLESQLGHGTRAIVHLPAIEQI